jgi:hypothetical protein
MISYRFLIGEEACQQILWLPPDEQWRALSAIEYVARHPSTSGLPYWRAEDARTHYLRFVNGWAVTFWIDEAEGSVRIIALDRE